MIDISILAQRYMLVILSVKNSPARIQRLADLEIDGIFKVYTSSYRLEGLCIRINRHHLVSDLQMGKLFC